MIKLVLPVQQFNGKDPGSEQPWPRVRPTFTQSCYALTPNMPPASLYWGGYSPISSPGPAHEPTTLMSSHLYLTGSAAAVQRPLFILHITMQLQQRAEATSEEQRQVPCPPRGQQRGATGARRGVTVLPTAKRGAGDRTSSTR